MKKIVIIGPESTGKSTLCSELAQHYRTSWCPEFARIYLNEKNGKYDYEDLLRIAKGQLDLEENLLKEARNGFYFIDTDLYVMKVWSEFCFQHCDTWILKRIAERSYDLYLLCDTDLEWQPDMLREYPDLMQRQKLFTIYKDHLIHQNTKWAIISGTENQRLETAINYIDKYFSEKP